MSACRTGKFSSNMVFFNHSTGKYTEYQYKASESCKNMAHLGNQSKISEMMIGDIHFENQPTRLLTFVIDHEKWFNNAGIATQKIHQIQKIHQFLLIGINILLHKRFLLPLRTLTFLV